MYSFSHASVKGNGTESVISARCTQPFTFPGISLGENSAHQLLISLGTLYCRVNRDTMGWEVCPTLLHLSAPLPALTPLTLSPSWCQSWIIFRCHHQSVTINFYFATISQVRLTIHCHHQSIMINYCLATSVRHGWLLPCHHQSDTADFSLPPVSRTPCPFVPNVLDIQSLLLRAIYIVHCSWMNIAVCKQVSGWLTLDTFHLWKLTQLNTLPFVIS